MLVGVLRSAHSAFYPRRAAAATPLFDGVVNIPHTMGDRRHTHFDAVEGVLEE